MTTVFDVLSEEDMLTLECASYAFKSGLEDIRYGHIDDFAGSLLAVDYLSSLADENPHLPQIKKHSESLDASIMARMGSKE